MSDYDLSNLKTSEEYLNALLSYKHKIEEVNYRISHKLRGSLATILGLIKVADRTTLSEENRLIFDWLEQKSDEMEVQIRLLSEDLQNLCNK